MSELDRITLGKRLLMSPIKEKMKRRLLVLIPKLSMDELRMLLSAFEDGELSFTNMVSDVIDSKKGVHKGTHHDLEKLFGELGIDNKEHLVESEVTDAERNEIMKRLQENPEDMYAFLVMIGPDGLDELADALENNYTIGGHGATKEEALETAQKLREFGGFLYHQEQEMKEDYEKTVLVEQIKVEKQKQEVLQVAIEGVQSDM